MTGAVSRCLAADDRGSPAAEFAIVLPVMLILMMGLIDLAVQGYVEAVLTGAVQKAGRDSTIQGNATQTATIDANVKAAVKAVAANATFTSTRTNFDTYGTIAGEPFVDSKYPATSSGVYDGICNHGESYTDLNGNSRYDLDTSATGQGGANDVTRYTMTVTYNRLFPIASMIGWGRTVTLTATTLLKNQPYATQSVNTGTIARTCP